MHSITPWVYMNIYIYPGKDSRRLRNAIELTARYRVELPSDVLLSSTSSSPPPVYRLFPTFGRQTAVLLGPPRNTARRPQSLR